MPVGFCTAEGVGSNPIGSTQKCADLQAKCEGSVEDPELIRGLVLQPLLQRIPLDTETREEHRQAVRIRGIERSSTFRNHTQYEPRFRALLTEGPSRQVELARA